MLMLRFLMPSAITSSKETKLAQKLMNAFVFHQNEDEILEENDFKLIAECILGMIEINKTPFPFNKMNQDINIILEGLNNLNNDINDIIKNQSILNEHPLMWSILELLENIFIIKDDFNLLLSTHSIIENNFEE